MLFDQISESLSQNGFCVLERALPIDLAERLSEHIRRTSVQEFKRAGVGRGKQKGLHDEIRKDSICWIEGETDVEKEWLMWAHSLKQTLNRQLFLGLNLFESHFAHYREGEFYKKHVDAFQGQSNRKLSIVAYLNPSWEIEYGGEMLLYRPKSNEIIQRVWPEIATVVIFLSEEFPHEVMPATRDRYSIAGWFR